MAADPTVEQDRVVNIPPIEPQSESPAGRAAVVNAPSQDASCSFEEGPCATGTEAPHPPTRPKVLSAFTGAGGLDLGLESAGYEIIACIDNDPQARATVTANRELPFLAPHDIVQVARSLRPESLELERGDLDVLAGAPPCQPYSKAALWAEKAVRGIGDPRGTNGLAGFLLLASKFLPQIILIENVPGFARGKNSVLPLLEHFFELLNKKEGTQYRLHAEVVDAVEWGIPQRRERAILVVRRDGERFHVPEPSHRDAPVRAYDALHGIEVANCPRPNGRWKDLLPSIPEGRNYLWHTPAGGGRPLFGYRTRFWSFLLKLAKAEPSWTLPASPGPATGPFHWDSRPLAIEEMLRLQTFPADWKVEGGYKAQVRQIGNATPPLLGEVLGRLVGEQVFGMEYAEPPLLTINRLAEIPAPEKPKQVPRKYRSLEGAHAPHPGAGKGPRPRVRMEESPTSEKPVTEGLVSQTATNGLADAA